MSPWNWLGIAQDASEAEVKRAYAKTLRRHRPDEDPQGFQTTHEAYRITLHWARQANAIARQSGSESDEVHTVAVNAPAASELVERADAPVHPELAEPPEQPHQPIAIHRRHAPAPPAFLPQLLQLLQLPAAEIDIGALRADLPALLAGLDSAQRRWISEHVATALEHSSTPPASGIVTLLADLFDWDTRFLRHRSPRIIELLAAEEVRAAAPPAPAPPPAREHPDPMLARLKDTKNLPRFLRTLTCPVRFWDPCSWPLWFTTGQVWKELVWIETTQSAAAFSLLDREAVAITRALMDKGHIGATRVQRWLAFAGLVSLGWIALVPAMFGVTEFARTGFWISAGSICVFTLAALYLRALVLQIYALPPEPARSWRFLGLLLAMVLLGAIAPDTLGPMLSILLMFVAWFMIGVARFLPGLMLMAASILWSARLVQTFAPAPDFSLATMDYTMFVLASLTLGLDHWVARRTGSTLDTASRNPSPMSMFGLLLFLAIVALILSTKPLLSQAA